MFSTCVPNPFTCKYWKNKSDLFCFKNSYFMPSVYRISKCYCHRWRSCRIICGASLVKLCIFGKLVEWTITNFAIKCLFTGLLSAKHIQEIVSNIVLFTTVWIPSFTVLSFTWNCTVLTFYYSTPIVTGVMLMTMGFCVRKLATFLMCNYDKVSCYHVFLSSV